MTARRTPAENKSGGAVLTSRANALLTTSRNLTLGYVRLSRSRKGVENLSPERQESMIRERAKHEGLECHVYRDTTGHKSGRSMKGRQGMDDLLYEVVTNPRVNAVIVAEFSRAHRSVFLSTQMIELLRRHAVRLIFANEMSEPDLNNPTDRFMLAIKAAGNEYYANQVAELQLIAVTNRRDKGEWVGRAPFGTVNKRGILKLSKEGAWVLPDGRYQKGKPGDSPEEGAIYRTYAESLARILHFYLSQPHGVGTGRLARSLNAEGYPFRNERGLPCAFTADDVRRALADWPAYGGFYGMGRAKDRPGYKDIDTDAIPLNRKRALFPLEDLKRVGQMRKRRGFEQPTDDGIIHNAKAYPLAQVVRCAACDAKAAQLGDERYRTRLGGHTPNARRYRHTLDNACTCRTKSVLADDLEALFVRDVLTRLICKDDAFHRLLAEASVADAQPDPEYAAQEDPQNVRSRHIKRCQEQLRRLERSYQSLALSDAEYDKQRSATLARLAEWEGRVVVPRAADVQLVEFISALRDPVHLWFTLDDEGRRTLAHSLFSYLLYDLDQHSFTEYRLTDWVEQLFKC